ncbi:MAG: VOC family protein [Vulcanimicrobiaceae bacterium]
MAVTALAFTMYPVTDQARAVAFYRDVLGLVPSDVETEFWTEFDVNGATFGIGSFEQVGKAGSAQSLALEVDDLDAYREHLASRGAEAPAPHELAFCRISFVKDPDGNTIWLHQSKPR